MRSKELIRLLKQAGWQQVSQNGSHVKMRKRKPNRNHSCT